MNCTGWLVAGPASRDREEIIYGRVDLADARRKRNWNEFNQVLRDRRTNVSDDARMAVGEQGLVLSGFFTARRMKKGESNHVLQSS